jgi:hypothetical protein
MPFHNTAIQKNTSLFSPHSTDPTPLTSTHPMPQLRLTNSSFHVVVYCIM